MYSGNLLLSIAHVKNMDFHFCNKDHTTRRQTLRTSKQNTGANQDEI